MGDGRISRSADGESWVDDPGTFGALYDVWASSATNAYAVGNGSVLRYDGSTWTAMPHPGGRNRLFGVWGTAPSDVWVSGEKGLLMHWDGSTWSVVDHALSTADLLSVWGSSPTDVFVVPSSSRRVLHWRGHSWSSETVPFRPNGAITGTARNNVYVAGEGRVAHYDGGVWIDNGAGQVAIYPLSATPSGEIFAVESSGALILGTP